MVFHVDGADIAEPQGQEHVKDFVEELCMEDFDLQIGGDFAKHLGVEGVEDHSNQKECTFKAQGCCTPDQQCTQGTASGCKGLLQGMDMLHETSSSVAGLGRSKSQS